jgi:inhibitor of KinA sporulation pathway (predicted exonuclease)
MAQKLDKIVVVDVEATCWEGKQPDDQQSDIIEIGICLLDVKSGEITDNQGIIVKPSRSKVSPFCTELTTITQEMVDEGISFAEACKYLKIEYQAQSRAWASFGGYDLKMFQRQSTDLQVAYPFGPSHINVKTLFALANKLDREQGMAGALQMLDIDLEGTHHRGVDDAKNIAKILWRLLDR